MEIPVPDPAVLRKDLATLDAYCLFYRSQPPTPGVIAGSKAIWERTTQIARKGGVGLVPALLAESEKLTSAPGAGGEEPLILVPIVIQLPVEETTRQLKAYESSGTEAQRLWAHEFLIEMEAYANARKKGQPSW